MTEGERDDRAGSPITAKDISAVPKTRVGHLKTDELGMADLKAAASRTDEAKSLGGTVKHEIRESKWTLQSN
jgi:hypothetical protein